jgi:hypothetical protein
MFTLRGFTHSLLVTKLFEACHAHMCAHRDDDTICSSFLTKESNLVHTIYFCFCSDSLDFPVFK